MKKQEIEKKELWITIKEFVKNFDLTNESANQTAYEGEGSVVSDIKKFFKPFKPSFEESASSSPLQLQNHIIVYKDDGCKIRIEIKKRKFASNWLDITVTDLSEEATKRAKKFMDNLA